MQEKKFSLKREGNRFEVVGQTNTEVKDFPAEKKINFSIKTIFSFIFSVIKILFSAIIFVLTFLVASPFFFLTVLINWAKLSLGFAIFWFIAYLVYDTFILNNVALGVQPFNGTTVFIIIGLGFVASILITISGMKD